MLHKILVPDVDQPLARLCWAQAITMVRCDRKANHQGPHSWEKDSYDPDERPLDAHLA